MKVIQINNRHRILGGSDVVVNMTINLLQRKGIAVYSLTRDSRKLGRSLKGKLRAFTNGIYSMSACMEIKEIIRDVEPDVIHVHEVFPYISPWILNVCRRMFTPVVMSLHNFRLICPTAHLNYKGMPCELCAGGREYWCVLKNCRGNFFESLAYAGRNALARKFQLYKKSVTFFIAPNQFVKRRLSKANISEDRVMVVPNMVSIPKSPIKTCQSNYIIYVGRLSQEKGIEILLDASNITGVPLCVVGDYSTMPDIIKRTSKKIFFLGFQEHSLIGNLYKKARFLVVPSTCYEVFPNSILEAMSYGLPVIASKIGGIPEMIDDGKTGMLFEPGNCKDLAEKIKLLWMNPDLCWKMGKAGRDKVISEYNENIFFNRLIKVYESAIKEQRII